MEVKKQRGKNFTEKEKETFLHIIDKYRPILENKQTDGSSIKKRRDAWEQVALEFNATAMSATRTSNQLKVLWGNLQRVAKKTVAEQNKRKFLDEENSHVDVRDLKRKRLEDNKNQVKTGGGQYDTQLTEVDARVLAMVEPQARPLENKYDDDNVYHGDSLILSLSPSHGAVVVSPISWDVQSVEDPVDSPNPAIIPEITQDNPAPLNFPTDGPKIPRVRKKYTPPKPKITRQKKTTAQLKRTLYLKRILLANMEIKHKKKLYELEIKIKEKELNKVTN